MLYGINKQIILESMDLLEEEISPTAKKFMGAGAAATGLAMGHAGALGGGVQRAVDSAGGMASGIGSRVSAMASDAADTTNKFYNTNTAVKGGDYKSPHAEAHAEHAPAEHAPADTGTEIDTDGEDYGLGTALGTVGAGALALGAGALGLKGKSAIQHSNAGRSFNAGAHGKSLAHGGLAHKLGSGLHTGKQRTRNALNALRGK